jgi:hypothetical protein
MIDKASRACLRQNSDIKRKIYDSNFVNKFKSRD